MSDEKNEPTVTVKTVNFAEKVEEEAQNMLLGLKLQHDQERLRKAAVPRLQELLAAAGLPTQPTEAETIARIAEQMVDQFRTKRIHDLAEQAAVAKCRELYPQDADRLLGLTPAPKVS